MSIEVIAYILAVLGLVVVVLTRIRLRKERVAGRTHVPSLVVNLHTVLGLVGMGLWIAYLAAPGDSPLGSPLLGIIALACLWVVAVCGLLILARWLPSRGRHVSEVTEDSWSDGPGLSVLAHVGMVVGVAVFTVGYMVGTL
ncbi:MAG TPA: hypothetical protein PLP61_01090 [Nocardioides sp.]|uniref:hypothetical protein n=1 Tax=Nocardioides sp. TaxID=35761 RepID=UPI002D1A4CA2|nr:hypothetical protein [Nocardioides sp.]HQR25606.1 hypothetical protein [Nocardioides sp.]